MMEVQWPVFKQFVDTRGVSIQFLDVEGFYYLYAIDGPFYIQSRLDKSNPENAELLQFEATYKAKGNKPLPKHLPFADKSLPCGRKLYTRIHGLSVELTQETQIIDFIVPYNFCKITGIAFIGGIAGDGVNLKVLDTATGSLTTIPNYMLNQFAFNMQIASNFHRYESDYDADLTKDLVIRLEFNSATGAVLPRKLGINIILHEVKS